MLRLVTTVFIVWPGMPRTNVFGKTMVTTALLKLLLDFVLESKKTAQAVLPIAQGPPDPHAQVQRRGGTPHSCVDRGGDLPL